MIAKGLAFLASVTGQYCLFATCALGPHIRYGMLCLHTFGVATVADDGRYLSPGIRIP